MVPNSINNQASTLHGFSQLQAYPRQVIEEHDRWLAAAQEEEAVTKTVASPRTVEKKDFSKWPSWRSQEVVV